MKYLAIMLLLCVACASASSHRIITPDGKVSLRVTCHPDIGECWEKAGDVCSNGYDVVGNSMHWGGAIADWIPGPVPWYNVLVTCK